jgi:hypothetical protein
MPRNLAVAGAEALLLLDGLDEGQHLLLPLGQESTHRAWITIHMNSITDGSSGKLFLPFCRFFPRDLCYQYR